MKYTPEQTKAFFEALYLEQGLNQGTFAHKVGFQPADLARYKSHKTRPRLDQIERLALALEIDIVSLLVILGILDTDSKTIPQVIRDGQNTRVLWNL